MKTCLECNKHKIISDRDPNDWFCDDDVAVVCESTVNDEQDVTSKWLSDHCPFKAVARSCRPHHVTKEAVVPAWCPKNAK